jgi:hypothetical protein
MSTSKSKKKIKPIWGREDNSCFGKKQYISQADAEVTAEHLFKTKKVSLRSYFCEQCEYWHLAKAE